MNDTKKPDAKNFDVKKFEAVAIDTIAAVTPWLAPLIPAYLVYGNMLDRLGYSWPFALIGATAVEFLGLSAVHTAVTFWQWNDNHKSERAPFWFAAGAGLFYVAIVLIVNAVLDIAQGTDSEKGVKILAHALLSLLSVDAAVIIAIRAQHARMLNDKRERRLQGKGATPGATGKTTRTGGATVARHDATVTRDQFVTAWRSNGHHSIAELAQELGVHVRTAQRWIKSDDEPPTG